jgi:hypothetical protein
MDDSVVDPKSLQPPGPVELDLAAMVVEGRGFTLETLEEDSKAFGNRSYVWKQVPEKLRGWRYTQTLGGRNPEVAVTAKRDTTVHIATATSQPGIDIGQWQPEAELTFHYTDSGRTGMKVFQRRLKAGEYIVIPQGNWTGGILLAPPEDSKAKP